MKRGVGVIRVHLVYVDDSTAEADYQLMGALIMPEREFTPLENYLAFTIDALVPEDLRDSFEFHASALYNRKKPFEDLEKERVLEIFNNCASIAETDPLVVPGVEPVSFVYGGVNLRKLRSGLYATARPEDVAFRKCLEGVEKWFTDKAEPNTLGILICDDATQKETLKKSFRSYRRPVKSEKHDRGRLRNLHDDMYFGDSAYSIGIQLADVWTYLVSRHLRGCDDTEHIYKRIAHRIYFGEIEGGLVQ